MNKKLLNSYIEKLLSDKARDSDSFIRFEKGRYINDLFGISFQLPKNWFIINANQIKEAANNQKLIGEYEYHKEELDFFQLPSILVTKYNPDSDKYYGLVTPTLNFNIISKNPDFQNLSLREYADLIECKDGFGYHMLKDFNVSKKGNVYTDKGYDFIKYDTEYLFEHEELDIGIPVELSVLNIDYGDFFLDFSMTDSKYQNQIETESFTIIEKSIELLY